MQHATVEDIEAYIATQQPLVDEVLGDTGKIDEVHLVVAEAQARINLAKVILILDATQRRVFEGGEGPDGESELFIGVAEGAVDCAKNLYAQALANLVQGESYG